MGSSLEKALQAVYRERKRQDDLWGDQQHSFPEWITVLTEEVGEAAQEALRVHFGSRHTAELREELVQVAAVAVQIIEKIDSADILREK